MVKKSHRDEYKYNANIGCLPHITMYHKEISFNNYNGVTLSVSC